MIKKRVWAPVIFCGAVVAWGIGSHAQVPKVPAENPFAGKILIVEVVARQNFWEYLKDAEVRELGGRSFLVGTNVAEKSESWSGESRIWLGINSISMISECIGMEDFQRRRKRFVTPPAPPVPAQIRP